MKKVLHALLVIAITLPTSAIAQGISAGVFIGSPMSGVTLSQRDLRFSLGVKEKGVAFDRIWNLGEWFASPQYSHFYSYTGVLWVNDDTHKWGARAGLGLNVPIGRGNIELYGEAGTVWYWKDEAELKIEGAMGLRVLF